MTALRSSHWTVAFLMAVILHLLMVLAWQVSPGFQPALRGGDLTASGNRPDPGQGLIVSLGKPKQPVEASEPDTPRQPLEARVTPQVPQTRQTIPPAPAAPREPAPEAVPSVAEEIPDAPLPAEKPEEAPETAELTPQPPLPKRKPETSIPLPEFEAFEERISAVPPPSEGEGEDEATADSGQTAANQAEASEEADPLAFVADQGGSQLGGASGQSEGALRTLNYRDRVLLWLKKNGAYPREAYRFFQEGVVVLQFSIAANGRLLNYELLQSSGYYLLDDAVHQMMERANPLPPIPADLARQEMTFTVPVRFSRS